VPLGQERQPDRFMPAPYSDAVPSGHAACTPGDTIKKPASGGAQKAELALDTTPIAQRVQEGAPAALYAPAGQGVQVSAPLALNVPAGQGVQKIEPAAE